jgi:hypothetical protein
VFHLASSRAREEKMGPRDLIKSYLRGCYKKTVWEALLAHFQATVRDPLRHLLQLLQLLLQLVYVTLHRLVFLRFGFQAGISSL